MHSTGKLWNCNRQRCGFIAVGLESFCSLKVTFRHFPLQEGSITWPAVLVTGSLDCRFLLYPISYSILSKNMLQTTVIKSLIEQLEVHKIMLHFLKVVDLYLFLNWNKDSCCLLWLLYLFLWNCSKGTEKNTVTELETNKIGCRKVKTTKNVILIDIDKIIQYNTISVIRLYLMKWFCLLLFPNSSSEEIKAVGFQA